MLLNKISFQYVDYMDTLVLNHLNLQGKVQGKTEQTESEPCIKSVRKKAKFKHKCVSHKLNAAIVICNVFTNTAACTHHGHVHTEVKVLFCWHFIAVVSVGAVQYGGHAVL